MIYIIFDNSSEWDDYYSDSSSIKYVSTNKSEAINYFDKYFKCYDNYPNEKYHYTAVLVEIEDGFNYYDNLKRSFDKQQEMIWNTILTSDNMSNDVENN